jgi:Putative Ig domain/Malectin domain/Bacterial Ig domain
MKYVTRFLILPVATLALLLTWLAWSTIGQPSAWAAPQVDGTILYRVNAGGPQVAAADASLPDWSADTNAAPSAYVTFPVDAGRTYSTTQPVALSASVPPGAPAALFQNERFDYPSGGPFPLSTEMRWAFPVTATLKVTVRLYFAEIFWNAPDIRRLDVEIDGVTPAVFDDVDSFALAGGKNIGFMRSYTIISDGMVNIDFRHVGFDTTHIGAIEIVEGGDFSPTLANPLADVNVLQDAPPTDISLASTFTDVEDGANLTFSVSKNSNPTLVVPSVNGTTLTLAYGAGQSGTATITVRATDASGGFTVDSFDVKVNGKPAFAPLAGQSVNEGATLNVAVTASDPENDDIALTVTGLPVGATFLDNNNKTGTLTWTPGFDTAGLYPITLTVTDSNGQASALPLTITVNNTNRTPVLAAISNQNVNEGALLTLNITANDSDNDPIGLTASGLPSGATFTDNGNGTATLAWTPGPNDAGLYPITVTATDSNAANTQKSFTITVADTNTNLPPTLAAINNPTMNEGVPFTLTVNATDSNGQTITLSATGLPTGATFTDNGNGTGRLLWTPTFADAGIYTVTITATGAANATATQTFTMTVVNINRKPTASATGSAQIMEGQIVNLMITATDPDGDKVTLTATGLPTSAAFTDNGNGTGSFTWPTTVGDAGDHVVTVTIKDALNASVTQVLALKVTVDPIGTAGNPTLFLPIVLR